MSGNPAFQETKKKAPRQLPLLTKLPRQKRKKKRKRDADQGLTRGLLDYYAPLLRQQQARLGTESTGPLNMLGGTGDSILKARDRSLRYKAKP